MTPANHSSNAPASTQVIAALSNESSNASASTQVIGALSKALDTHRHNLASGIQESVKMILGLLDDSGSPLDRLLEEVQSPQRESITIFLEGIETLREEWLRLADPMKIALLSGHLADAFTQMRNIHDDLTTIRPGNYPIHFASQLSALVASADKAVDLLDRIRSSVVASLLLNQVDRDALLRDLSEVSREKTSMIALMADEATQLLNLTRERVQAATVSEHAKVFKEESLAFDERAWWWFTASVAVALVTAALAWENLQHVRTLTVPTPTSLLVQVLAAKLFFAALLVAAIRAALSQYRAARHNAVINRHRSRALQSFEALVNASQDKQTKAAVLLQATNGIFSPQPTGYLGRDFEQVASAPSVHDMAKIANVSQG